MDRPSVTCLMMTYNRVRRRTDGSVDATLVEEALESFLRQDYPNRRLLIVNDTPGQVITFRHPLVDVYNYHRRFPTLGDKYRAAVRSADTQYVTPWDDDDVYLPHRLSDCAAKLEGNQYLIVHGYLLQKPSGMLVYSRTGGYAADWFDRELLDRVGYAQCSFGSDAKTRTAVREAAQSQTMWTPGLDEHFYIYRWVTTGQPHLSGIATDDSGYAKLGDFPIDPLIYELQPHWRVDYASLPRID